MSNVSEELLQLRKRARRRLVGAIALVIFAFGLLAAVGLQLSSLQSTQYTANSVIATAMAREYGELMQLVPDAASATSSATSSSTHTLMLNTDGIHKAKWGKLCAKIVEELTSGFKEVDAGLYKLSAFIPVCKAQLDLGPEWLDRYIRAILAEALANGLEEGIVMGDGNDQPIGMVRDVSDDVAVIGGKTYPEKAKVKVNDFEPATMGNLISMLGKTANGKDRDPDDLILLVNPQDYYLRVMPATTVRAPDGTYRNDIFPVPLTVIKTAALPRGQAVFGIGHLYFAPVGMNKNGRIEYSDDYHFLEDERVYLIKLYANGFPVDNNAFLNLDISGLQPMTYRVTTVPAPAASNDASLSALKLGSLNLTPGFTSSNVT